MLHACGSRESPPPTIWLGLSGRGRRWDALSWLLTMKAPWRAGREIPIVCVWVVLSFFFFLFFLKRPTRLGSSGRRLWWLWPSLVHCWTMGASTSIIRMRVICILPSSTRTWWYRLCIGTRIHQVSHYSSSTSSSFSWQLSATFWSFSSSIDSNIFEGSSSAVFYFILSGIINLRRMFIRKANEWREKYSSGKSHTARPSFLLPREFSSYFYCLLLMIKFF